MLCCKKYSTKRDLLPFPQKHRLISKTPHTHFTHALSASLFIPIENT